MKRMKGMMLNKPRRFEWRGGANKSCTRRTTLVAKRAPAAHVQRFVIPRPSVTGRTIQRYAERATTFVVQNRARSLVARDGGYFDDEPQHRAFPCFQKRRGITSELTRRATTTLRTSCR